MKMFRRCEGKALIAMVALMASVPAMADVKAGVDAWSRGDYAGAIRQWSGPADAGDADAQFNLGQAYKLGRGVARDLPKAESLFAKAAANGHIQASDNYGLLLFQRGERQKAMPYVQSAAGRGDPRAQYLLGLAYFNGDVMPRDWVRGYALVSLAQQAGLPQATPALTQMDQHIPIEQRRESIALAAKLAADAQATRDRQVAAVDLGDKVGPVGVTGGSSSMSSRSAGAPRAIPQMPVVAQATGELEREGPAQTARRPVSSSPATAGADYTISRPPVTTAAPRPSSRPVPTTAPQAVAMTDTRPARAPAATLTDGPWRVQLGAFGVSGNADAMWNRVKARPELSGHGRIDAPAGRVKKLQAGGFATQDDAQAACRKLSASGFDCIPVRN